MTALRALCRHDRPVLVTGLLFLLAALAIGLFLPLPAGAASTGAEATRRLELEAWLWVAWPVWLAVLGLLVWLRVRAVNARERSRRARPVGQVIHRYEDQHPSLPIPTRSRPERRPARHTRQAARRPTR